MLPGTHAPRHAHHPGHACPPSDTTRCGQWAGGLHPTGMHSCLTILQSQRIKSSQKLQKNYQSKWKLFSGFNWNSKILAQTCYTQFATRLHSSRMHTACLWPYLRACTAQEGAWSGGRLVRGGGECSGSVWSGGRVSALGGAWSQGVWYPSMHWGRPPLWTEFLTHTTENITLPQTSFAGGNYQITSLNLSKNLSTTWKNFINTFKK